MFVLIIFALIFDSYFRRINIFVVCRFAFSFSVFGFLIYIITWLIRNFKIWTFILLILIIQYNINRESFWNLIWGILRWKYIFILIILVFTPYLVLSCQKGYCKSSDLSTWSWLDRYRFAILPKSFDCCQIRFTKN